MDVDLDETTYVLLGVLGLVALVSYLSRPAQPPTHPFLLGRQAVVARTRQQGETPVYSSSASASGPFASTLRPENHVKTLGDVVKDAPSCSDLPALARGLVGLLPHNGRVAVLISDPHDALVVTLALATASAHPPVVLQSGAKVQAQVVAVICSADLAHEAQELAGRVVTFGKGGVSRTEVSEQGAAALSAPGGEDLATPEIKDVALSFVAGDVELPVTHLMITAALSSLLSSYPNTPKPMRPTASDHVLSLLHPATPFGFTIALLALYTRASLTLASTYEAITQEEATTILYLPARVAPKIEDDLRRPLSKFYLGERALASKIALAREGVLTKSTIWDRLYMSNVGVLPRVRYVAFDGLVRQRALETIRGVLGAPAVALKSHPLMLAPLTVAMMWDTQRLPPPALSRRQRPTGTEDSHVGTVPLNVELKIVGKEDDMAAEKYRGELLVRSPTLSNASVLPVHADSELPQLPPAPGAKAAPPAKWMRTGLYAEVAPEGTFWLLE